MHVQIAASQALDIQQSQLIKFSNTRRVPFKNP